MEWCFRSQKVSEIVLGCMTYGGPNWQPWIMDESPALPLVKHAGTIDAEAASLDDAIGADVDYRLVAVDYGRDNTGCTVLDR
ncbi:hypothetical protein DPV78_011785 [Talaromyces pinophilus]|nr:hypothetical protein DPV78_011785 [Talaromyces pinophilus]